MRAATLVVGLALAAGTLAAEPAPVQGGDAAVALAAEVEVERAMIAEDARRHEQLAARRAQTAVRLQNLYASLDHVVRQEADASRDELESLNGQIDDAAREFDQIVASQRALADRMIDHLRRIELLEGRLGQIRESRQAVAGPLSGSWQVVLLPAQQRGEFTLTQTGTIVTGTYTLEGGWTGSLQGTLVNRKVYLVRIDSRLGRSMELQGTLSSDGSQIRGTWLNYDLAAEGGSEGQWSATRAEGSP